MKYDTNKLHIYKQIIELRNNTNAAERGYQFEQLIREIQPWDHMPPIVMSAGSEQIDGVFTWRGNTFLIESKAKRETITCGSHDWEDFALKINKRSHNGVIGLFCSLNSVHDKVILDGIDLNKRGFTTLIIHGEIWDSLLKHQLPFSSLLEYMIPIARIKYQCSPNAIEDIISNKRNKDAINLKLNELSQKFSSTFFRRHHSEYFDGTYTVRTYLDKRVSDLISALRPAKLEKKPKISSEELFLPKQICILRTASGAGKTALSLYLAKENQTHFGFVSAANEVVVDTALATFTSNISHSLGIDELSCTDKPLVYIVDSLDESDHKLQDKLNETKSTLKYLDHLNAKAVEKGFRIYPILIIFTVRTDYWGRWESRFEGHPVLKLDNEKSHFTPDEFSEALHKYSLAYKYEIDGKLNKEQEELLSLPFNMVVFSETYKFGGKIRHDDLWNINLLHNYFARKRGDFEKHFLCHELHSRVLLETLSFAAWNAICRKSLSLLKGDFLNVQDSLKDVTKKYFVEIVSLMESEQILFKDNRNSGQYAFRHIKFIEYLAAYYISSAIYGYVSEGVAFDVNCFIDNCMEKIDECGLILAHCIHDNIRHIFKQQYVDHYQIIDNYYSASDKYVLNNLRYGWGTGTKITNNDIGRLKRRVSSSNPNISWSAFFIIADKNNMQSQKAILESFECAWDNNESKHDRYKMLVRISSYNYLILNELIFRKVLKSDNPYEWQWYLGIIIENEYGEAFKDNWVKFDGKSELHRNNPLANVEWYHVLCLLDIVINGKEYTIGDILYPDLCELEKLFEPHR